MLVRYIKENYKSMCNIKVMRKSEKRQVLSGFLKVTKTHITIKIPFVQETMTKDSNKIFLPR
jgi:hypothetical protein